MFLRLRQLCLVARDLEPVVEDLRAVFELEVCHRDPEVARFGLHNALLRVGTSFIEVVAPLREGTTAGRYLERRGGDGGYMVILDCADVEPWRQHVAAVGVRVAASLEVGGYQGLQLHPRDTGGALLEINRTEGGDDLLGAYWPAGSHWQHAPQSRSALAITGAVVQGASTSQLASRWSQVLRRPALPAGDGFEMALDNAHLRFVDARDGRGDGLTGVDIDVADPAPVLARARERGCLADGSEVSIGGVRWRLYRPQP